MPMQSVLIIHGGAGSRFNNPTKTRRTQKKITAILDRTYEKLLSGKDALDAVTFAVKLLEDDPRFNAGTGSLLQSDGKARLTASVMDGDRERFAAVINLQNIKNPVLVARTLLEEEDRVLSDGGAYRYAKKSGFKPQDTRTANSIRRWKRTKETGFDTVGACALDEYGHLACATSTGGRGLELPGRVSDSGMPAGNYANRRCAISATGVGEDIMDESVAVKIATRVEDGMSLEQAMRKTFRKIKQYGRKIGVIGIDRLGKTAWMTSTDLLIYGWRKGNRRKVFES